MRTVQALGRWLFDRPYLLLAITMACWAGNAIVGRGIRDDVPPVALAYVRWLGALLIALPFAWPHLKRDWSVILANKTILVILGVLGIGLFNTLLYTGLQDTTALNGALLQSANPVLIALAVLLLFQEVPRWVQGIGIAVSLVGVLIVLTSADLDILRTLSFKRGDVWISVAVLIWATYTALLRLRPPMHWLSFIVVTFAIGVVFLTPFLVWEIASGQVPTQTPQSFGAAAYVVLFPSLIAYIAYNRGVELAGSTVAGAFHHLIPIFTVIMAFVFLGEVPQLYHAVGFVLVIGGVTIASRR